MLSRRTFFAVPLFAACGRRRGGSGFRGYAFVANEDGEAVAAVDLEALAVVKHIALQGAPSQVLAGAMRPSVYALTPSNGLVQEIQIDRLSLGRKMAAASSALSMQFAPGDADSDERSLYVLTRDPRALVRIDLDSFRVESRIALPEDPVDFTISPDGKTAVVTSASALRFIDLETRRVSSPAGEGEFGAVRFLSDGSTLIAANRGARQISLYDAATRRLIAHLPVSVRPDQLCFNADGGQLFVTGEGMDAVVVIYPYHTPEVAETVLAGHAPGAMAASQAFLFVASPQSGDLSILEIATRKVIAVVSVGSDPGFIAVTPDDQFALVLNRKSGDVAVLRIGTITKTRSRTAALLTVIPVGSRPVCAAVRAV
jgi:YVTN family beta-propeller protein